MSQHDYDLANQAGAAFRADLNLAIQALATLSSGATAPATTYAYMLWADTATGLLKQRNAANSGWIVVGSMAAMLQRGYIHGLTISNNAIDALNDIDIAPGACVDSTHATMMRNTSTLTKRLDAAWSAGNNGGWLDTGAIANTTYHVFAIQKDSDGSFDSLASVSATSPTMPTGYTYFRRLASIVRATGAIRAFIQDGDFFQWVTAVDDVSASNPGIAAVTRTLTVPSGINVLAQILVAVLNSGTGGNVFTLHTDLATTDLDPVSGRTDTSLAANAVGGVITAAARLVIRTNSSAQIRSRFSYSDATVGLNITTLGWTDRRGRDA